MSKPCEQLSWLEILATQLEIEETMQLSTFQYSHFTMSVFNRNKQLHFNVYLHAKP